MTLEPVCEGARAVGHSWPSLHWWLSLTASDQGAWFAGAGAFAAAFVALWISDQDRRQRKKEEGDRADICAHYITVDLQRIADQVMRLRKALLSIDLEKQELGYAQEIFTIDRCIEELNTIRQRIDMSLLMMLPTEVGQKVALAIGGLPLSIDAASEVVYRMRAADEKIMRSQNNFTNPAEMIKSQIAGLASFFTWLQDRFPDTRESVAAPILRRLGESFRLTSPRKVDGSGEF
jgi:hypothetical protein